MTADEARELYTAAGALEGVIVRNVPAYDADERLALAAELARAQAAFRREATRRAPDWDRLFELHHAFHELLRARLAGPRLRLLLDGLRPHLDRYEYFYGRLHGSGFEATFEEHDAIVAAVESGRADVAEHAVRANWFNGADRLAGSVQRAGEAGFLSGFASAQHPHSPRRAARAGRAERRARIPARGVRRCGRDAPAGLAHRHAARRLPRRTRTATAAAGRAPATLLREGRVGDAEVEAIAAQGVVEAQRHAPRSPASRCVSASSLVNAGRISPCSMACALRR
jgi:hypothetical protein